MRAEAFGALGLGLRVNDAAGLPFDFLNPKRPALTEHAPDLDYPFAGRAAACPIDQPARAFAHISLSSG